MFAGWDGDADFFFAVRKSLQGDLLVATLTRLPAILLVLKQLRIEMLVADEEP